MCIFQCQRPLTKQEVNACDWCLPPVRFRFASEQVFTLGDFSVCHGIAAETAFLGLDADVGHRFGRGASEVAVAVGGYTDYGTFGDVDHVVVNLKLPCSGENDIVLLILLMRMEEGNGCSCR